MFKLNPGNEHTHQTPDNDENNSMDSLSAKPKNLAPSLILKPTN